MLVSQHRSAPQRAIIEPEIRCISSCLYRPRCIATARHVVSVSVVRPCVKNGLCLFLRLFKVASGNVEVKNGSRVDLKMITCTMNQLHWPLSETFNALRRMLCLNTCTLMTVQSSLRSYYYETAQFIWKLLLLKRAVNITSLSLHPSRALQTAQSVPTSRMDSTVFTDVPKACRERMTRWCGSIRMRITCASYATKTAPKGKGIVLLIGSVVFLFLCFWN